MPQTDNNIASKTSPIQNDSTRRSAQYHTAAIPVVEFGEVDFGGSQPGVEGGLAGLHADGAVEGRGGDAAAGLAREGGRV